MWQWRPPGYDCDAVVLNAVLEEMYAMKRRLDEAERCLEEYESKDVVHGAETMREHTDALAAAVEQPVGCLACKPDGGPRARVVVVCRRRSTTRRACRRESASARRAPSLMRSPKLC